MEVLGLLQNRNGTRVDKVVDAGGKVWSRKTASDPQKKSEIIARNGREHAALRIYDLCGVPVPKSWVDSDGTLYKEFISGKNAKEGNFGLVDDVKNQLLSTAAVDMFLANWDVLEPGNILQDEKGIAYRIDAGGSLDFRAQNGRKDLKNLEAFHEQRSMRDNTNWILFKNYHSLTDADLAAQIEKMIPLREAILSVIPQEIRPTFATRFSAMENWAESINPSIETNAKREAGEEDGPDLRTVEGFASIGHAIFHDMPNYYPNSNSPIRNEGFPYRARMVAGLTPSLSTTQFKEGDMACNTFGGSLHLLAAGGTIQSITGTDAGTRVYANGERTNSRGNALLSNREIREFAGKTSGDFNEVVVNGFEPGAVLINIDDILRESIQRSESRIDKTSLLEILKGADTTDDPSINNIRSPNVMKRFLSTVASSAEDAVELSAITEDKKLPIYAIIGGELYNFIGFNEGYYNCLYAGRDKSDPAERQGRLSAREYQWSKELENNSGLMEEATGEGKTVLERINSIMQLDFAPTPVRFATRQKLTLNNEERATLACSVMPYYKSDKQDIPLQAFINYAPDREAQERAVSAAEKLPFPHVYRFEEQDIPLLTSVYTTQNDSYHNLTRSSGSVRDWAEASCNLRRLNQAVFDLVSTKGLTNERMIPTDIYAYGFYSNEKNFENYGTGRTLADAKSPTCVPGFQSGYDCDPLSNKLFIMVQERLQKYGSDGVIYVDTRLADSANRMHLRDPQYIWRDDPKKNLQDSIDKQWQAIQKREKGITEDISGLLPKARRGSRPQLNVLLAPEQKMDVTEEKLLPPSTKTGGSKIKSFFFGR